MYTLDPHTHNEDVLNFLLTMFGGTRGGIDMSVEFFTSIFNRLYLRMTSPKQAKILKAFTEKLICSDEFEYMEIAMRRFWALHIVFDTPFAQQMNIKTHVFTGRSQLSEPENHVVNVAHHCETAQVDGEKPHAILYRYP